MIGIACVSIIHDIPHTNIGCLQYCSHYYDMTRTRSWTKYFTLGENARTIISYLLKNLDIKDLKLILKNIDVKKFNYLQNGDKILPLSSKV